MQSFCQFVSWNEKINWKKSPWKMYLNLSILSVFCICKIRVFANMNIRISEFSSHYGRGDGGVVKRIIHNNLSKVDGDGGVVKGRPGLRGNKYLLPFMGDGGCASRHGTVWARSTRSGHGLGAAGAAI